VEATLRLSGDLFVELLLGWNEEVAAPFSPSLKIIHVATQTASCAPFMLCWLYDLLGTIWYVSHIVNWFIKFPDTNFVAAQVALFVSSPLRTDTCSFCTSRLVLASCRWGESHMQRGIPRETYRQILNTDLACNMLRMSQWFIIKKSCRSFGRCFHSIEYFSKNENEWTEIDTEWNNQRELFVSLGIFQPFVAWYCAFIFPEGVSHKPLSIGELLCDTWSFNAGTSSFSAHEWDGFPQ